MGTQRTSPISCAVADVSLTLPTYVEGGSCFTSQLATGQSGGEVSCLGTSGRACFPYSSLSHMLSHPLGLAVLRALGTALTVGIWLTGRQQMWSDRIHRLCCVGGGPGDLPSLASEKVPWRDAVSRLRPRVWRTLTCWASCPRLGAGTLSGRPQPGVSGSRSGGVGKGKEQGWAEHGACAIAPLSHMARDPLTLLQGNAESPPGPPKDRSLFHKLRQRAEGCCLGFLDCLRHLLYSL